MDASIVDILETLARASQNPEVDPRKRELAMFLCISYNFHRNVNLLVAQASALAQGKNFIHSSHRVQDPNTAVYRHGISVQNLMNEHGIFPNLSDLDGRPISLLHMASSSIEPALNGPAKMIFYDNLLAMERKANEDLARCVEKYGYHYIFKVGLQEYYVSKLVTEHVTFWRRHPLGDEHRARAQRICYEFAERRLRLNASEKQILIQITHSVPEDANKFCK
ncbi:putative mating locus protein [Aspergillus candidus]|uniref:Mating locus protein n=1 Tax=Aspergillus candidus TaxID=41067 RepID=A0A2I2FFA4_ASPCN|nr:hypothetical protein BDW47DRAFT_124628 [Aspergillus candidus]PLB39313.1 hypothetical protein BDW47DRAFT_124628 [Aspergillus candidus]